MKRCATITNCTKSYNFSYYGDLMANYGKACLSRLNNFGSI
jgi:hypothetical protein